MTRDMDLRLAPDVRAPETARRSIETLRTSLDDATVEEAMLLVSELVTNSVRHAELTTSDTIAVRIRTSASRLRIEVTDPGPGFDPSGRSPPDGGGGWGLWLLDRIATRWGLDRSGGACVWFELEPVSGERPTGSQPGDEATGGGA